MATTAVTDSAKSLATLLSDYEIRTYSHFVVKYSDKKFFEDDTYFLMLYFGSKDLDKLPEVNSKQRLLWSLSAVTDKGLVLPFMGVPFLFLGNRTLACHHGPDLNKSTKIRQRDIRAQKDLPNSPKRRFLVQPTKKMDCPVVIHMKKIVSFPDFKIEVDSEYARRCAGKQLKEALANYEARILTGDKNADLKMKLEYYILLPDPMTHENHVLQETQGIVEPWRGRKKTCCVVSAASSKTDIADAESHVEYSTITTVASVVDILDSSAAIDADLAPNLESCLKNLVYYENTQVMAMLLSKSKLGMRYSRIDQTGLSQLVLDMQQEGNDVSFVPTTVLTENDIQLGYGNPSECDDDDDTECKLEIPNAHLMFVYQSPDMKRLYRRYGNQMVVLDAVYRSGRYPIPLFFLLVRTNVNYQTVAVFAVQQETVQAVAGALFTIKSWSPDVSPKYAMVDSFSEEISALERTFPGTCVYISDYHRECSWNNWLAKPENGLTLDAENVKSKLKKIANAAMADEVGRIVAELETSPLFMSNQRLSSWFHNRWKPLLTKWSAAYRNDGEFMLALLTNNGSKRLNEDFKFSFLSTCQPMLLSELLRYIFRQFLPGQFRTYVDLNVRSSVLYRRYNDDVPLYLRNRPRRLIDYMRKKIASVDNAVLAEIQIKSDDGVFLVPASSGQPPFEVSFGSESVCCSCTCVSYQRARLLCKHFYSVFAAVPGWNFEKVSPIYTNNPLLLLDEEVLAREVDPSGGAASDFGHTMKYAECLNGSSPALEASSEAAREKSVRVVYDVGSSRFQLKNERLSARRVLKKLLNLTYSVNDAGAINIMRRKLDTIHREMKKTSESQVVDSPVARTLTKTVTSAPRKQNCRGLVNRVGWKKKEKFSECNLEISVVDSSENGNGNVSTTYVTLVTSDMSAS